MKYGTKRPMYDYDSGELTGYKYFTQTLVKTYIKISPISGQIPTHLAKKAKFKKIIDNGGEYEADYWYVEDAWAGKSWKTELKEAEKFLKEHPSGEYIKEKQQHK